MKKSLLKPFLQKHMWIVPIYGVILLILYPVLVPLLILIRNREQFAEYYSECLDAFKKYD